MNFQRGTKHTRLKWILLKKGWSQVDVLNRMSSVGGKPIARWLLTDLCNGKRENPTLDTLNKIALATGVSVYSILPVTEKITVTDFRKCKIKIKTK